MLSLTNLLFIFSNQYIPKYRPAMQIQVGWHSNITKQNFKYLFDDNFVISKQKTLGFLLASSTKFNSVSRRGVFRNFSSIFHGAFCVNVFCYCIVLLIFNGQLFLWKASSAVVWQDPKYTTAIFKLSKGHIMNKYKTKC